MSSAGSSPSFGEGPPEKSGASVDTPEITAAGGPWITPAALALAAMTLLRALVSLSKGTQLTHVSGAWTALALDLNSGIFYRPLFSPELGFGGTRFFPLHFTLHALLIQLVGNPTVAGHIVDVTSTVALVLGVFALMRRFGLRRPLAWPLAILVLASTSTQHALTTIRGDVLPATLNIWGLWFTVGCWSGPFAIVVPAILFTLAFSAKITSLYGALAAGLWLWLTGRRIAAGSLVALTLTGCIATLGLMQWGSGGRIFGILAACTSGGASLMNFAVAPSKMLRIMTEHDPGGFLFFAVASAALLVVGLGKWRSLAPIYFIASLGATVFIFGSPGIYYNHLIDLHVAGILLLGWGLLQCEVAGARALLAFSAIAAFLACAPALYAFKDRDLGSSRFSEAKQVLALAGDGTVFSEDPTIPTLGGQRPYLLDAFMLCLLGNKDAALASRALELIRNRSFAAVVLQRRPGSWEGRWGEQRPFERAFLAELDGTYKFSRQVGLYAVYLPKP